MIICPRRAALHNVFVLALQPTKKMCKSEFVEMKKLNTAGRFITLRNVNFYTCQPGFSYSECGGLTWFYNPVVTLQHKSGLPEEPGYKDKSHIEFYVITTSNSPTVTAVLSKAESQHTHLTHPTSTEFSD